MEDEQDSKPMETHDEWRRRTLWDRLGERDDDFSLALLDLRAQIASAKPTKGKKSSKKK